MPVVIPAVFFCCSVVCVVDDHIVYPLLTAFLLTQWIYGNTPHIAHSAVGKGLIDSLLFIAVLFKAFIHFLAGITTTFKNEMKS